MLLNLLNNYLQNQTTGSSSSTAVRNNSPLQDSTEATGPGQYEPSPRAIMISAVAMEFDVTSLSSQDLNRLQDRIQQYGLLSQHDLKILGKLHSGSDENDMPPQAINALDNIDQLSDRLSQELPYNSRKALQRVQTLIHNLASANPSGAAY